MFVGFSRFSLLLGRGGKPRKSNKNLKNRKFWILHQFFVNIISRRNFGCWIDFWALKTILSILAPPNRYWLEQKSNIWRSEIPQAELWILAIWWGFGMKFVQKRLEMMFWGLSCFLTQKTIRLQDTTTSHSSQSGKSPISIKSLKC